MSKSFAWIYTAFVGLFLLLQGTSTLSFRLVPALDQAFPALLATTQMMPVHSLLHITTSLLAFLALRQGRAGARWFALGFGLFYLGLGVLGTIQIHPSILHMQPFDHPFHILLGALGLLALAADRVRGTVAAKEIQKTR